MVIFIIFFCCTHFPRPEIEKKKIKRSSRLCFSKERRRRRRIGSNREQATLIRIPSPGIPVPGRRIDVYRACRIHVFPLSEIRHTGMARRNVWKTAKGIAFGRSVKLGMVVSRLVDDLSAFLLFFLSPFFSFLDSCSIPCHERGYRLDSRNVVATASVVAFSRAVNWQRLGKRSYRVPRGERRTGGKGLSTLNWPLWHS